jgi:hypothetical protein
MHVESDAVRGQQRADLQARVERLHGLVLDGNVRNKPDLRLQRQRGVLRLQSGCVLAGRHRLSGWTNGSDLREGCRWLLLRLGDLGMPRAAVLLRHVSHRGLRFAVRR